MFSVGKLSQPSPVQTRSARKKKAELNATLGTPSTKSTTPTKGKKLNSKTTPKSQKATPVSKAKGQKAKNANDFKLELENDDMDSDDLDSDDNAGSDNDSDDVPSDEEILGTTFIRRWMVNSSNYLQQIFFVLF